MPYSQKNNPVKMMKSALEMHKAEKKAGMHRDSAMYMNHSPMKMGHSPMEMGHSPMEMGHESPAKMGHESPMKRESRELKDMPIVDIEKGKAKGDIKKGSPAKVAKPDFPDIDGDGNTTESMKKAAADKSGAKMKKPSPNKVLLEGPISPPKDKKYEGYKLPGTETKKATETKTSKKSDPYAEAKKRDPKLDSYVKERKKHKPGSAEYEAVQAKINKAYGKTRSSKLKAAQIAAQKKKDAVKTTSKTDAKYMDKHAKIESKGNTKLENIEKKAAKKKGEVKENVDRKLSKATRKHARKKHGRGSKEHLEAKKKYLEAKEADRQGERGGKKQGLFRRLSSKINKRKQAKLDKKLAEKE